MLVILFLITLHLHPVAGQAQQSGGSLEVTGRVMDADGTLLQGVTVEEIGVKNGTMTDGNGTYTITMSKAQATLRFRLIGYVERSIEVNDGILDVTLEKDLEVVDEVVVVGYGEQRKASVVGAITNVQPSRLSTTPSRSLSNNLAGMEIGRASCRERV